MPSPQQQPRVTERDMEILLALDRCPMTALQILKLSRSFDRPFTEERRVRERMHVLGSSGRVRRWRYAAAGRGSPNYYTLSPLGYQLLHGKDAGAPTKRAFDAVSLNRQHHSHSLADFIVHTAVSARQIRYRLSGFYPENRLRLVIGEESLFPDCAFQILPPKGSPLSFFVEIDNSTERVRSDKNVESWQRKLRLYEALRDRSLNRFRVLIVATRSEERLSHILSAARATAQNPQRSLFYGTTLAGYLNRPNALTARCFRDPRRRKVAMVGEKFKEKQTAQPPLPVSMEPALSAC